MFERIRIKQQLTRIQNDPMFSAETQSEASKLASQVQSKATRPNSPNVAQFLQACSAQAQRDVFTTPIEQLAWVREGKWSETAASLAPSSWALGWAGAAGYVSPFHASVSAALNTHDASRLLRELRSSAQVA